MKAIVIEGKRFLKHAKWEKYFLSKAIARKVAFSKTARLYFENIIDSGLKKTGKPIVPIVVLISMEEPTFSLGYNNR